MKKLGCWIFIGVFVLICFYPLLGAKLDKKVELSGVTSQVKMEPFSVESVMSGKYQTGLNNWIENNFPGRSYMIKWRSQLRYSLLRESPNSNVVVGKDKYLFEPNYIERELGIKVSNEAYFSELVVKLENLQAVLNDAGKELYIFITPSKAYFCNDKIPGYYFASENKNGVNDYSLFMDCIEDSNLNYFDSRTFIESKNYPALEAPVFYSTGIHWSHSYGNSAAKAFSEYITTKSKWTLSSLKFEESEVSEPVWPDADLYQSMNLMKEPKNVQYYSSKLSVVEEGDRPNVFLRGGSFMGQSLSALVAAGVFGKNIHLENNYYFTDTYSKAGNLSSYTSYDEVSGIKDILNETDIFILEVNEANISGMSWGFIDYLLDYFKTTNNSAD